MIKFSKLRWRNLLSTGQQFTEIQLDKSPTTLVLGTNGSGKSTMLDALCVCLFKKPFRKIKLGQLINTINAGECEMEVTFSIGTHEYRVRRGFKPDLIEIWEDGVKRKKDSVKKDDQAYLEEDILKVNYQSFTQIVILGNAKYTPFMQLPLSERRAFIEEMWDLGVFSAMNDALKLKLSLLNRKIDATSNDVNVVLKQIEMLKDFIRTLEQEQQKASDDTQRQIDDQAAIISTLEPAIVRLTDAAHETSSRIKTVTQTITDQVRTDVAAEERSLLNESDRLETANTIATSALQSQMKRDITELRNQLRGMAEELSSTLAAEIAERNLVLCDTSDLEQKLNRHMMLRDRIANNKAGAESKRAFYIDTKSCDACGQNIAEAHRQSVIADLSAQIDEFTVGLAKLDEVIANETASVAEAKTNNRRVQEEIRRLTQDSQKKLSAATEVNQEAISGITETAQTSIRNLTAVMQSDIKLVTAQIKARITEIKTVGASAITAQTAVDTQELQEMNQKLQTQQRDLNVAKQLIMKLRADMKKTPGNIEEQRQQMTDAVARLKVLSDEKDKMLETRHLYDVAAIMLKDSGIKATIIQLYLPTINRLVNKYLADLDFFLSFSLDQSFTESFKSRHLDTLQYNSFSEGEKLRIDLALLFAWREIARMKNSCSTNLLILDEVIDSSLDGNGTECFIKILNALGNSSNVFVISHKNDVSLDLFTDSIRFEKKNNFSSVVTNVGCES